MKRERGVPMQVHGSLSAREREGMGLGAVDFAVNTNPYGPAPSVVKAAQAARLDRYPDQHAEGLRGLWADRLGLTPDEVAFGNGGTELIWAACRAFLRGGRGLVILGPTFGEPRASAEAVGAPHLEVRPDSLVKGFNGESALQRLALTLGSCSFPVGLVYLCSPNNPTGTAVSSRTLERIRSLIAPAPLLLDSSFESLRLPARPGADERFKNLHTDVQIVENVLELRSFTKDFGIPGLRLGALFGDAGLVGRCLKQLYPWSVSSSADAAGRALLAPEADRFLVTTRALWHGDARALWRSLSTRGITVLPSTVPFGLVLIGDGCTIRRQLMERGVHVRDCASFGLAEYVRVVGRPASEIARFLGALDALAPEDEAS